jgi:acyl carrier protein
VNDSWQPTQGWREEAEKEVREVLAGFRAELRDWPGDEDLISSRQLDSLIFVSVLIALEERSGREVDPGEAPGAKLRTIDGLTELFYGPQRGGKVTAR